MGVLRPAGSLPARVYWTRRLVVLLALAAVVVLVVVGARAILGPDDDPAPAPDPASTTGAAGDGTEPSAPGTPACAPADLGLQLVADATSYPAGALPTFTVRLVNDGGAACLVDAGEAQRQILITSGSDRIWASTDCASDEPLKLLLAPGEPDERQVQWDRNRSVEGCAGDQPAAQPGTYQAVLTLAGVSTEPVVFGLE
ncbi:hypothetical protein K5O09_15215 [Cellulomonas sp. C5510]|nr:hypothetical protein K5O09_15215 [Cellulomonas sp. C5510]